jgi:hypothetical protein
VRGGGCVLSSGEGAVVGSYWQLWVAGARLVRAAQFAGLRSNNRLMFPLLL